MKGLLWTNNIYEMGKILELLQILLYKTYKLM